METDSLTVLTAVAVALVAAAVVWRRATRLRSECEALRAEAEKAKEILAASPDGLFFWDHASGAEVCSRRLAVLLDLPQGTGSRFSDLVARFAGESGASLAAAVDRLRREGLGFELLLPVIGGRRNVRIVGVRTEAAGGRPLADILWVREASPGAEAPAATAVHDRLKALLDALPLAVWLRDGDLNVAFGNRARTELFETDSSRNLARRAQAQGRALAERHRRSPEAPALNVTEMPLEGWAGTVGFAVEEADPGQAGGGRLPRDPARDDVLQHLGTAVAIFAPNAELAFFNRAYADLWRLDPDWLATKPSLGEVLDRLREKRRLPEVADFRAFKEEQLALFRSLGEPVDDQLHLPDGTTVRRLVSRDSSGGLAFIYENVTARLDLERSYKTLAAVQRATLDHLYEGVAVFGGDGRLKLSNPTFAKLWFGDASPLSGALHLAEFVELVRPLLADTGDWRAFKESTLALAMKRQSGTGRMMRRDGTVVDYAHVPLPDGAVLLSFLDVSDSARVEKALRQKAEALQEADRLKSEFIANVSYEVRTPLTSLIGFAEVLSQHHFGELNARQMDYVRGILEASQSLMSVIGDILDLATIEANKMALAQDSVDLHSMLVSVLALIRERARRKSLKLELDCAPDIGWIVADERRLKQVLFHLLSNAVAFTPERGRVRLSAARTGRELALAVSDTGVGIPKADQKRVFEAFHRGGSDRGGAGLGLSLVKRFIELHGGTVEIKSAANRGTTVTCRLPAESVAEEPLGAALTSAHN